MKTSERGEIATILTLGVLVVIGVSAMVSSLFLNQKKTTNSSAAEQTCSSKPNIQPPPPAEKEWVADCGKACTANNQCDFGIGNEEWSRWCFGFSGGSKCMKQVYKSESTTESQSVPPATTGSTTTTSSSGSSEYNPNNLNNCHGADNTWVKVNEVKGGKRCCAAKYNPKNDTWAWATWSESDKCKDGMPVPAGTSSSSQGTAPETGCINMGEGQQGSLECENTCKTDPNTAQANYSCKYTGGGNNKQAWCCPPGANSTKPDPSPVPACKEYPSDLECYRNCSKYKEGWSCTGDNSTSCCFGGKNTGNTPPKKPATAKIETQTANQTPVIGGSTTENSTRPCTEGDYTIPDSTCGGKPGDFCGLKQRKYELTAECTPPNLTNSRYMCKNDNFCNSNPQAPKCYEDFKGYCTDKEKCNQGETSNYTSNCGDVDSGRTCCIPPENGTGSYTVRYSAIAISIPHFPVGNNDFWITLTNTKTQIPYRAQFINVFLNGKHTFSDLPFGTYNVQLTSLPCAGGYSFAGGNTPVRIYKIGDNGESTLSWKESKCDQQDPPAQANTATQVKNYTIEVTNMCASPISSFSLQNAFGVGFVFINTLQKDEPNRVTSSDCNNWGWMTYWINGKSKAYLNTNINGCSSIYSTVRIAGPDMCN